MAIRNGGNNTQQWRLAVKISVIIGTQLATWLSYIALTIYYSWFSETGVPHLLMEVFVTIILPLNSLINPVVYSDLYTVIEQRVVTVAGKLVSMCWDGEPEEMKAGNDVEMVETKKRDEGR